MTNYVEMIGGNPADVVRELKEFQKSAKILSSSRDRLIEKFAQQWVGVVKGEVRVSADTSEEVFKMLERDGADLANVVVRFIDREMQTLIL